MSARPGTGNGSSLVNVDCTLSIAQGQMMVSRDINEDKADKKLECTLMCTQWLILFQLKVFFQRSF